MQGGITRTMRGETWIPCMGICRIRIQSSEEEGGGEQLGL